MTLTRRLMLGAPIALATPALAQPALPRQSIRLLVPFAPGSGSDTIARIVANGMKDVLDRTIVVENRPGGGGTTGTEQGARAAPDGTTIVMGTSSSLGINAAQNPHAGYRVDRDFAAVAGCARSYYLIATHTGADAPRSLGELVARLRAGGGNFAMGGVGTIGHLTSELFLMRAGVRAEGVSYRGSAPALTDLAAGREMFSCDTLAAMAPFLSGGRLRALAVTAPTRLAALPEVPTTAEAGVADLVVDAWFGMVVPAATPAPIVATLGDAVMATLAQAETRARLDALMVEPMPLRGPEFATLMRESTGFWVDFVRRAGLRIEF
ncbi:tripartite tricarboxylate transporter substrate binding protein [Roseomonas stagni]|uniref:Tripartite tricarboxylate transporter substrate binding protein n=1 Tax=Falsiroseomonas algicola TaxID=2716930 RepID=A0A6M1LJA6_9PROT|nr:tripartite tricarboxylate transporter substrate-binding protein [Falsiroseomonas algicola]NGM20351.1 tripartite tricarboxylate transporter substrate binding protein [Falsiroseomonas algicola]